jgi:hypothetical protein
LRNDWGDPSFSINPGEWEEKVEECEWMVGEMTMKKSLQSGVAVTKRRGSSKDQPRRADNNPECPPESKKFIIR